jgi:hypothetical protein
MLEAAIMGMGQEEVQYYLELCSLCACPPSSEQPIINIFEDSGIELELCDKINKYLTIKVHNYSDLAL